MNFFYILIFTLLIFIFS